MPDKLYSVKHGDTLWDIAAKHLGDPLRWPEIYDYNNRRAANTHSGTLIADPDLIFVGQTIRLPVSNSVARPAPVTRPRAPSAKPGPNAGKSRAKQKVRSIPFKYSLDDLPSITVASPAHIATISLKGSITLQAMNPVDFVTLTRSGFEITAKREADHAFGKLVSETQIGFNATTNEISFECGFTTHSNSPYAPKTRASAGMSSKTGLPVLKGSIIAPDIKGKIGKHFYLANGLSIEIEITPRPPTAKPQPVPIPSAKPVPDSSPGWDYLLGGALVAGAGLVIVATIVEDVATLGLGIADDAPSFAAAAAMFTGGIAIFKTVNTGVPVRIEGHGVAPDQI
ncbi:MAG TPA: LysM peptidoglycan-binding domain-containing protein [Gammaproteobacteria bacterium]|nr:LysM peptidoglycan-binding domain-containing protein [Gammaproteobacteria bacterium]